jgi:hypothetical protein
MVDMRKEFGSFRNMIGVSHEQLNLIGPYCMIFLV